MMRWLGEGLERGWPLILGVCVALVAYFQARGVSHVVASTLANVAPAPVAIATRVLGPEKVDATPILRRNPFDSVTGPLDGTTTAPEPAGAPPPQPTNPLADPKCDFGHVTLIIAADRDYSFAAIETKDGKSRLARVGDAVAEHQLVHIARRRIWLEGTSARCQMRLGDKIEVPKRKRRIKRKRTRRKRKRSTRLPKHIANKIERVSPTEYRIERSALDDILEQQAKLMRRTRVRPIKRGDEVVGMRVSGVRGGTLLNTIGIKSGDVIKSINGFDLTNPQKALEAYGRLRSASRLTVQLERGGKPLALEYGIL